MIERQREGIWRGNRKVSGYQGVSGLITVEYHADLKEVQGDQRLCALLSEQTQPSPFDRLSWWQLLQQHCDLSPLLASARDEHRVAVLPLRAGRGHLHGLTNWYSFALRPVCDAGNEAAELFEAIAADLRRKTWRVTLSPLPDEQGETLLLQQAFAKAGWRVQRAICDSNHVLTVAGRSFADYFGSRPGPLRTTVKRKSARIETVISNTFDRNTWETYEEIYHSSWKPEEGSPAFLRAFAQREAEAGRLRLGIARHQGQAVAVQFWTVDTGTAYIHKLAHLESARQLSPGTILSAAMFEQVIDRDQVEIVDFGTGDDAYKRDWMDQSRPRYRLDMFNPSRPRAWPYLVRAAMQQLAPGAHRG